MCDSDDDEFLSASEGDYDEKDDVRADVDEPKCIVNAEKAPTNPLTNFSEEDTSQNTVPEEKPIAPCDNQLESKPEDVDQDITTGSSKESLLDDPEFSTSSGSGSLPMSLSSEKQRLLEEVVKESLTDNIQPDVDEAMTDSKIEVPEPEIEEKSQDDGGWDDFSVDGPESLSTPEEKIMIQPEIVREVPVITPSPKKKVSVKKEETSIDDLGGWDDWDESAPPAATEPKKDSIDGGWEDWSVVDQKKVAEEKKEVEETDPWFKEQLSSQPSAKPAEKKKSGAAWGWGGLVSAVGETLSSTIETSLGLPSAEEVARRHHLHQKELEEKMRTIGTEEPEPEQPTTSVNQPLTSGFGMLSGLVSGGIDVLETIGKKTFEAVTVKDESKGRRRMIFTETSGQNLSDVLKELKEQQDKEVPFQMGSAAALKQTPDFASLFGRSEGMAHLEALEMVSTNRPKASPKFEREYFASLSSIDTERVEDGHFSDLLLFVLKRINLPYEPTSLTNCDSEIDTRLAWCDGKNSDELFSDAVDSLVEFTASSVQVISKLANLLLIIHQDVNSKDFVSLCTLMCQRINHVASRYVDYISVSDEQIKADELVTQLHVESSVAVDFIKQAHRLLCPMFQSL